MKRAGLTVFIFFHHLLRQQLFGQFLRKHAGILPKMCFTQRQSQKVTSLTERNRTAMKQGNIYLNLYRRFEKEHACWTNAPRSVKPLMSSSSDHTKRIKKAIALSCFRSAVSKSCQHLVITSVKCAVGLCIMYYENCAG